MRLYVVFPASDTGAYLRFGHLSGGCYFHEAAVVSRHIEILLDRFHDRNSEFQFFRNRLVKFICLPRNHIVQLILFAPASFRQHERR